MRSLQPHPVETDRSGDANAGVDGIDEVGEMDLDHRNVGEDLSGRNPEGG